MAFEGAVRTNDFSGISRQLEAGQSLVFEQSRFVMIFLLLKIDLKGMLRREEGVTGKVEQHFGLTERVDRHIGGSLSVDRASSG